MFLFPNGKQYIVNWLNATYKASFDPAEFNWVGPRALDASEQTAYPGKDTSIQIRSTADSKVYGNLDLFYNRYDISTILGKNINLILPLPVSKLTVVQNIDCLGALNQFFGLELTKDEVKVSPVDYDNMRVRFEILPNSILWTGVLDMAIKYGDSVLSDLVTAGHTSLDFAYPNFNTNNGQAPIYAYSKNFTTVMRKYVNSGTNLTTRDLMDILSATGDPWTIYRSPSSWNLFEAEAVYNGPNTAEYPTDSFYDSVLVVKLALYCTNLAGNLYLQYNSTDI